MTSMLPAFERVENSPLHVRGFSENFFQKTGGGQRVNDSTLDKEEKNV